MLAWRFFKSLMWCSFLPTLALKAISFRIISTVNSTVNMTFSTPERCFTCSDWSQCCGGKVQTSCCHEEVSRRENDQDWLLYIAGNPSYSRGESDQAKPRVSHRVWISREMAAKHYLYFKETPQLTSSCHSDATIWGQSYLLKKIKFDKEANSPMPNGGYAGVHHSKHTKRRHENVTPGLSSIHFLSRLSCSASRGDDTYSRKEDYASTDHHSQNTVCTFTSLPSGSWTSPACSHIREEHSPSRCSPSHYCEKFKCSSKVCVPWSTMWSKRDDIWAM